MSKLSTIDKIKRIEKMRDRYRRGVVPLNDKELSILNSVGYRLGVSAAEIAVGIINTKERLQAEEGTTETATDGVVERLEPLKGYEMSTFESLQSVTCDNCPKVAQAKYFVDEGNFLVDIPPGWVAMAPEMASSGLLVPMRCGPCFELLKGKENNVQYREAKRTSEEDPAIHYEWLNRKGAQVVRDTNKDLAADAAKDLESLVFDLAFAIEDPCGGTELHLARVLVKFAQRIKPEKRRLVAVTFDQFLALNENALIQG